MRSYRNAALGLFAACAGLNSAASVVDLDSSNYEEYLNSHDVVMVEYYASWCGICKDLQPVYEQTAAAVDPGKDIRFARVDCVAEKAICERYTVPIYPTFYAFQGAEEGEIYNGPREPEDMTRFVERRYKPSVATLSKDTIEDFKSSEEVAVVAYLASDDTESNRTFTAVAESLLDEFIFGATADPQLARTAGVSAPAIVLYKQYDEGKVVFDGKIEQNAIEIFIDTASYPLVGEFEMKKSHIYFNKDRVPFAGIFSEDAAERAQLAEEVRSIAEGSRGKLNWATIDVSKPALAQFAGRFNLQDGQWPAISILDGQSKYPFSPGKKITKKALAQYTDDFISGRLEPHVKGEPIPATQDGPVTVVVRDNFEDVVMDHDYDVLLQFYAPWCGHCKKLAPDYEKLASIYAEQDKRIRIAKVDATANDIPGHPVSSYPTLKFFPSKVKRFPVQYLGNRTFEDLANFVQTNSMNKVDILAGVKESLGASDYFHRVKDAAGSIVDVVLGVRTEKEEL